MTSIPLLVGALPALNEELAVVTGHAGGESGGQFRIHGHQDGVVVGLEFEIRNKPGGDTRSTDRKSITANINSWPKARGASNIAATPHNLTWLWIMDVFSN